MSKKYICYILKLNNRTYNGSTNDIKRRLRQHNGEIVGGARATSRKKKEEKWIPYCIVTGFKDHKEALQTEWRIKRVEGRRRPSKYSGVAGRIKGLNQIFKLERFTSNCIRTVKEMPLIVYLEKEYHKYLINVPPNIEIKSIEDYYSLPLDINI